MRRRPLTAGYWESEMILIVEDPAIAAALESHINTLLAESPRVNRNDPEWAKLARRRQWMRRWLGVMSVYDRGRRDGSTCILGTPTCTRGDGHYADSQCVEHRRERHTSKSGGSELNTANNSASDPTKIVVKSPT